MDSFPVMNHTDLLDVLGQNANKIALELVFAQAGDDNGLLPINCLLGQMEDTCETPPVPPEIRQAIRQAREWLDGIFAGSGFFDAASILHLSEWTAYMENACGALRNGHPAPPIPAGWIQETALGTPPQAAAPISAPSSPNPPSDPGEEMSLVINLEQDGDLLREFANESHEHLQNIELGVLVLEEHPADADTLNSIFRAFHTFKGGSGLLNLTPMKLLAHDLESLLDLARQHKLQINSEIINIILEGGDLLKRFVTEIELQLSGQKPPSPVLIPIGHVILRARAVMERGAAKAPAGALPTIETSAPANDESKAPAAASAGERDSAVAAITAAASMVKVATFKLDSLVDLVGEMVIAQSLVAQDSELKGIQDGRLSRNLAQLSRITGELQRTAMSLRMVPIRTTFQKMNRLVRDIATAQGKQVELVTQGEETEIDRKIVEDISDPLIHMVRNSVDHGIEKPEDRLSSGKPAQGKVCLRAYHQGGNVVIEISDDGRGLNRERIREKALEKGLIQAGDVLEDSEIFNLIFAPGFSTAQQITEVSGRGVGMDVVRRNIDKLRGKIEIQSQMGQGSRFTIHLPLTLAIIDGLIVGVGEHRYILPTLSVCESFRPTRDMLSTVYGRGEMINVRGRLSPLLRLHEFFGVKPQATDPCQGIVVLVGTETERRCLLVDQLLGKQEVVIKSLGETFKSTHGLAGAAILGDGRVGLILDVDRLVRLKGTSLAQAA